MSARVLVGGLLALAVAVSVGGRLKAQEETRPHGSLHAALGTGFTYQGRLDEGGLPATGDYDFQFALFDAESFGTQTAEHLSLEAVDVSGGLFTVLLDFGPVFRGEATWLEVHVRPAGSPDPFVVLSPRQPITAAPYAEHSTGSWSLYGNALSFETDAFLGTSDSQALVFKTNDIERMRLDEFGNLVFGAQIPFGLIDVVSSEGPAFRGASTNGPAITGRLGTATSCSGSFAVAGCGASDGMGVMGTSIAQQGVYGHSNTATGVEGSSGSAIGVLGNSTTRGVVGTLGRTSCAGSYAVGGCAGASVAHGVIGRSLNGIGVHGEGAARGVVGTLGATPCVGEFAVGGCAGTTIAAGVYGRSDTVVGVMAHTASGELFRGVVGPAETKVMRVDAAGRGYFNGGTQTGGADFAESIRSADASQLEPGDVLMLDPAQGYAVTKARGAISRLVAGVYATQPAVLAVGSHGVDDSLDGEVPVALLGVVPTKVTTENGSIAIGDLLVTSSTPGYAMKAIPDMVNGVAVYPTGAVLGKAFEAFSGSAGVIFVMVTLR
jgi:hypothetical protein